MTASPQAVTDTESIVAVAPPAALPTSSSNSACIPGSPAALPVLNNDPHAAVTSKL